MHVIEDVVIPM